DRVVERITDHRQDGGDDGERDLQAHHRKERERREDVVRRRDDGGNAETPLETDRQIDQCDDERDEDRGDRPGLELGADAWADRLGTVYADGVVRKALTKNRSNALADRSRVLRRGFTFFRWRLDEVRRRVAEARHFRAAEARLIDSGADDVGRRVLRKM